MPAVLRTIDAHSISFRSSSVKSLLTACPLLRCVRMRPTFLLVAMNACWTLFFAKFAVPPAAMPLIMGAAA